MYYVPISILVLYSSHGAGAQAQIVNVTVIRSIPIRGNKIFHIFNNNKGNSRR